MSMLQTKINNRYITILSDGSLREKVEEGTEGAVKREYELKNGSKGSKWEKVYTSIVGNITSIEFKESDFGKQMYVGMEHKDEAVVLALSVSSPFTEDLMKKLPNIDLTKTLWFGPYVFETENGKVKKGITIKQGEEKVENFFYDPVAKTVINGYPEPQNSENFDKEDWKVFFMQSRKFLVNYIIENVCPKLGTSPKTVDAYTDAPNPEEIPF